VARIARVDFLLVSTEKEALLLEESLIKKHRPRYNIVLRDDKRSLLFRLDKAAAFPRLTMTRHVVRDGSAYFGPYASASAARATQKLVGAYSACANAPTRCSRTACGPACISSWTSAWPPACFPWTGTNTWPSCGRWSSFSLAGRSPLCATCAAAWQGGGRHAV
jgi:excinuclease ABC subunit C